MVIISHVWVLMSLLQPFIYNMFVVELWSCGIYVHMMLRFVWRKHLWRRKRFLASWRWYWKFHIFRGIIIHSYSLQPYIVGIMIHLDVPWCVSCYAMTIGVLGLTLCWDIFGSRCYVVSMESLSWFLCTYSYILLFIWCILMLVWFPHVGIFLLLLKVFGWYSTLDDVWSICFLMLMVWEAWILIYIDYFPAM